MKPVVFFSISAKIGVSLILALFLPPVPSISQEQQNPTIIITTETGIPNAFEFVGIDGEKVEVRKSGGLRVNFSRDQIVRVTNAEVSSLVAEASSGLALLQNENIEEFPELLQLFERAQPRLEGMAKTFDWLIPEASRTAAAVQKALWEVRTTLRITNELEETSETLDKMVEGRLPIAATWEEIVDDGFLQAKGIPFASIQKEMEDDLAGYRRTIRLNRVRRTREAFDRIQERGEKLAEDIAQGRVTASQRQLLLKDLERQASNSIPDPKTSEEALEFVADLERSTEALIEEQETKRRENQVANLLERMRTDLDESPESALTDDFAAHADEIESFIEGLPASATRESYKSGLDELLAERERLAAAAIQTAASPALTQARAQETAAETSGPGVLGSLLSDWRIPAIGVGAVVIILLVIGIFKKGQLKKATSAAEIEDVVAKPMTSDSAEMDLMNVLDSGETAPKATSEKKVEEPAIPVSSPGLSDEDDPFGLSSESTDAPAAPAPPASPVSKESPEEDDPLEFSSSDEEEEDVFAIVTDAPSTPEKDAIPEESGSDPLVEDPFQFEEQTVVDEEEQEKVSGSSSQSQTADPVVGSGATDKGDPLGLSAGSPPASSDESETAHHPAAPPQPQERKTEPPKLSTESAFSLEDVLGGGDSSQSSEESSEEPDDLFAPEEDEDRRSA